MSILSVQQLVQPERAKLTSSPCINICTLIDDHCIGCGRSKGEITEWRTATEERKLEILERIADAGIQRGLRGV